MKGTKKYDNWMKFLTVSVIVIIVCVFTLTITNTHLAKVTYGASTYTDLTKAQSDNYSALGFSCSMTSSAKNQYSCTCNKTDGCGSTGNKSPKGTVLSDVDVSSTGTMISLGWDCSSQTIPAKYKCSCDSPKIVSSSGRCEVPNTCTDGKVLYNGGCYNVGQRCSTSAGWQGTITADGQCINMPTTAPASTGSTGSSTSTLCYTQGECQNAADEACRYGYTGCDTKDANGCYIMKWTCDTQPSHSSGFSGCPAGQYSHVDTCKSVYRGYNCVYDSSTTCYKQGSSACYKCTNAGNTYYTYASEPGCSLAESYDKCDGTTGKEGKNRLFLMNYDKSTGTTSTIDIRSCSYGETLPSSPTGGSETSLDKRECELVGPGGAWYDDKECTRPIADTVNVALSGDLTWWRCNGSGSSTGSGPNPTGTDPTPIYACYLVNHKYVWASSKPSGGTLVSSKTTAASCSGCENGYSMDSSNNCVKTSSNVPVNPPTGTVGIVIAWVVGLAAIVYTLWYFKKSSSIK